MRRYHSKLKTAAFALLRWMYRAITCLRRNKATAVERPKLSSQKRQQPDERISKREEGSGKLDKKDSFEYIAAEIRRQHDLVTKTDESLETKLGISLGFIFLVLSQIAFRPEFTGLASKGNPLFFVFVGGLIAIFVSIMMGIKGFFFVTDYATGPRIEYMINAYENGEDLNQAISRQIAYAITLDIERSAEKASWLKWMLIAFIIGLIIFVALEVVLIV